MKRKRKTKVCISIATKGDIRAETVAWLLRTFVQLRGQAEIHIVCTRKPLEHARNEQILRFLKTDCSHIFFLDSDCLPQDRTIQKLLAHNLKIVSAPHTAIINGERGLMVVDPSPDKDGYIQHRPLRGLQGPDVRVGCAGLLVAREVFEKLGPPWFRFIYDEYGLLACGEDFDFCERALALGYEIWADCDLWQRHLCSEWV
jgi:hypothetical protein